MNQHDVAEFLKNHPEFFNQHSDLLASITLPHPHGGRAISLSERQMMALREKNKSLESKLVELVRFGQENDAIVDRLQRWTRGLLLLRNARLLPDALTTSLAEIFAVPAIELRIWEATDDYAELPCTAPVPVELIKYANRLGTPFVGPASDGQGAALALLATSGIQSIALIPLRRGAAPESFGLIVLGSPDVRRFHGGMGTEVLSRIGETASAALTRLLA
jgi:uncharacterized protein YigA (DUF484 family)